MKNNKINSVKKCIVMACAVAVTAASLAGCGESGKKTSEKQSAEMPKSLSVFSAILPAGTAAGAKDNNDILSFQLMEEMTGCHVEWTHPVLDAYEEKFKLLVAAGNYPDIIVYHWAYVNGGPSLFAEDEVIVPITDMIDSNMPNFSKLLKDNPEYKAQIVENDEILYVPYIRGDKKLGVFLGPLIRTDWLDKLGLEVPKTTDELYSVLKAFKEKDPNGNGQADEVPMTGSTFESQEFGIGNLMAAFGTVNDFYLKNGKVTYGVLEDEFKEGLGYIAKLYSEGLIDKDYLINDREKLDSKMLNDKAGFTYAYQPGKYYEALKDTDKQILGIEHLRKDGENSKTFISNYNAMVYSMSAAVTTACENPEGALKWLDAFYSDKGIEYMNFGKEGDTFEYEDGYPKFTDKVLNNPEHDRSSMIAISLAASSSTFPTWQDWRFYEQTLTQWGRDSIEQWAKADTSDILPQMKLSAEDKEIVTQKMAQIETYTLEMVNKIIIGREPIDSIDTIREKIKKMGIDDVMEIYQNAYKAYMKR